MDDKVPDLHWKDPLPQVSADELRKIIMSRRSVRGFDPAEQIPEEIIHDCLNMGLLAPNSDNLQPWQFIWVRTPEKKAELIKICLNQPAARTASELIVCVARPDTWPLVQQQIIQELHKSPNVPLKAVDYYRHSIPRCYDQGAFNWYGYYKRALHFFKGFKRPMPREPMTESDMRVWAAKSTSLACQNIMLGFRAHGYDTCPMEGFDSRRLKKLLALPRRSFVTMVIGAGKRTPNGIYGPRYRFPRSQFIKIV